MKNEIDARGLNCPQPVILTKKALERIEKGRITTIVDNNIAKENVIKLAKNMTCDVSIEEIGQDYYINILKEKPTEQVDLKESAGKNGLVILIGKNTMGIGDRELGQILIKGFIKTLLEVYPLPETIIFLNSGVNLTVEGSEVINTLRELEEMGVEILSCGTCLNYYNLEEKLAVGQISNMYSISEKLLNAVNTISV